MTLSCLPGPVTFETDDPTELFDAYDAVFARWSELPAILPLSPVTPLSPSAWITQTPETWPVLSAPLAPFWARAYTRLTARWHQHAPLPDPAALQAWTCALTHHDWMALPDETFCVWCEQDALWALPPAVAWACAVTATDSGWMWVRQTGSSLATDSGTCSGSSLRRTLQGLLAALPSLDLTQPGWIVVPTQSIFKAVTLQWWDRWRTHHWQTHDQQPVAHADLWAQLPSWPETLQWRWVAADAPFWHTVSHLGTHS